MKIVKSVLARGMNEPIVRQSWGAITRLPIIGAFLHDIARRLLPLGQRVWVRVRYEKFPQRLFWLSVEPRYEAGHYLGTHELAVQEFLVSHLKPGDCFFDVGAHVGYFSMLAAVLVEKRGLVFALEPDRRNAALLRECIARNSLGSTIQVVEQAIWSQQGSVQLLSAHSGPHSNTGMSKIVRVDSPDSYEVPCTTLDKLCETRPAPTLIKIDVEGAESEVLKGADKLFQNAHPKLLCEIHDAVNAVAVRDWLAARGYLCRWIEESDRFPRHLLATPGELARG